MKNFKKSIAIIGSIAMLFSVSAVSVSAVDTTTDSTVGTSDSSTFEWYNSLTDEQKETFQNPIDGNGNRYYSTVSYHDDCREYFDCTGSTPYNYPLNNGDVYPVYYGTSVITDSDGNIISLEGYNYEADEYCGFCTIYNGKKYRGLGVYNGYELVALLTTRLEHPEYQFLNNNITWYYSNLDGSLNGYVAHYYIYNHKITLPNNETITLPKEASSILVTYNTKGEYVGYSWSIGSVPAEAEVVSEIPNIGNSSTVGDSDVLPSEPTGIRGDVNYDGKVNVADIITLRRYLLHIIEW